MFSICMLCYTTIINCSKKFTIKIINVVDVFGGGKQMLKNTVKYFYFLTFQKVGSFKFSIYYQI